MTTIAQSEPKAPRVRRRRWAIFLGLVAITIGVPAAIVGWRWHDEESALAKALAETERRDPKWRFADVIAGRAVIADEENSSLQVVAASTASGKIYDFFRNHLPDEEWEAVLKLPPTERLNDKQLAMLRQFLFSCPEALVEARKLRDMPRGRPRITYSADFISTLVEPVQLARTICSLLQADVILRAEEQDFTGAMDSCRAMLNAGRSIGDEPFAIGAMVRCACDHLTIDALERLLAHGDPGEPALAEMQAALEAELAEPTLLAALRGERAGIFEALVLLEKGKIRPSHVAGMVGAKPPSAMSRFVQDHLPSRTTADRAAFLSAMNELVDGAKLPVEQQKDAFDRTLENWPGREDSSLVARKWIDMSLLAHLRMQANLRCAVVALAAERYRIRHGAWPETAEPLVKDGLLKSVPLDPFDAQPLRYKHHGGRVLVYSVGPDGTDDGGVINRHHEAPPGSDLGFRLWKRGAE